MRQVLLSLSLFLLITTTCQGQFADFESFGLEQDTFLNGSDGSMGFEENDILFPNLFNTNYDSWSGWAISTMTDTLTPGFINQYSCIAGEGAEASTTYGTTFVLGETSINLDGSCALGIQSLYINNSTYAYLSMQDGDQFAKKFGGEDGTDPDYFFISIKSAASETDSVIFYLADFRSDNPDEDYILDEWTQVNLESLPGSSTYTFELFSSDVGDFGNNTPAYFCIDNVSAAFCTSVEDTEKLVIKAYPNPTADLITVQFEHSLSSISLYNTTGEKLQITEDPKAPVTLDLSELPSGIYLIEAVDLNQNSHLERIVKQ